MELLMLLIGLCAAFFGLGTIAGGLMAAYLDEQAQALFEEKHKAIKKCEDLPK